MDLFDDEIELRRLTLDDVDEWLAGEDSEQIRWFEFPGPATRSNVEQAVNAWQESWRAAGPVRQWGVCMRSTGAIAGGVEVRKLGEGEVNLSYVVFPVWRRQGVATRASRLALAYARTELGATAAVMKILEGNTASLGVAQKLGAVQTGTEASEAGGRFVVLRVMLQE
jgi:RimJ/RimL family protein N-acetyltransferase